jgi:hypothetical protein
MIRKIGSRRQGVLCRELQRRDASDDLPTIQVGAHVAGLQHYLIGAVGIGQAQ